MLNLYRLPPLAAVYNPQRQRRVKLKNPFLLNPLNPENRPAPGRPVFLLSPVVK